MGLASNLAKLVSRISSGGKLNVSGLDTSGSDGQVLTKVGSEWLPQNVLNLSGALASTSGTSISFTGIPSWAKRITVMFAGVSTNGTSFPLVQIGSGSYASSGYSAGSRETTLTGAGGGRLFTTGFGIASSNAINTLFGQMTLTLISPNNWVCSHVIYLYDNNSAYLVGGGGTVAIGGALDRVRVTTVNGTDTFDAGSINIMYE